MGIERATSWPGCHASEPGLGDIPALKAKADRRWKERAKDKLYLVLYRMEPRQEAGKRSLEISA